MSGTVAETPPAITAQAVADATAALRLATVYIA